MYERLLTIAEENRREKTFFDNTSLPEVEDYGAALVAIKLALGHLEESIPNGQITRSASAHAALVAAAGALAPYLFFKNCKETEE